MNNAKLLERCLDAIQKQRELLPFNCEVLVLDNASEDGAADLARSHQTVDQTVALQQRQGKAANDTLLMQQAKGRYCLLLNDDSELLAGATEALYRAAEEHPDAALIGAALLDPELKQQPSAWRFPSITGCLAALLQLHNRYSVQSSGQSVRRVDWAQSAALLVRKEAAAAVSYLDTRFFIYSDEVDFAKRLNNAGWYCYYCPQAQAIHHEQLKSGGVPERRIVEFSRNRDLYMRVHHGWPSAVAVRVLTALTYGLRALAAALLPAHDAQRYWFHVRASLQPGAGEGLREAAAEFNQRANGHDAAH